MAHNRLSKILPSKIAAAATVLVFVTGCSALKPSAADPSPVASSALAAADQTPVDYVAAVRGSTMSGYPAATIGKAFEAAFHDFQWHSTLTSEGVRVVNFTGLLPANLRQDCLAAKPAPACAPDAKVTFQWTFAPNSRLFHLNYIDPAPWPAAYRSTRDMLLFIYG